MPETAAEYDARIRQHVDEEGRRLDLPSGADTSLHFLARPALTGQLRGTGMALGDDFLPPATQTAMGGDFLPPATQTALGGDLSFVARRLQESVGGTVHV
jgi:hypothetical protein